MAVTVRRKKGSKKWWTFAHHNGQRASTSHATREAAKAYAVDLDERVTRSAAGLPSRATPTFAACAEKFLATVRSVHDVRESTAETYASFITSHLLPFFGPFKISAITPELIEQFIQAKRAKGGSLRFKDRPLAASSLRCGLQALGMIFTKAIRDKHIPASPLVALGRVLRRRDDERDTVEPFTGEEVRAILTVAEARDPDWATFLRAWFQTGLRSGELRGLQVQDYDPLAGTVTVKRTFTRKRLGPPKRGGTRVVSLLHPTTEASREWRPGVTAESRAVLRGISRLKVTGLAPESFLFGGGAEPLSLSGVAGRWARTLTAAGVRFRNPEQCRHTFASTMLSRNAPPLYVARQGGWKTPTVLFRTYARWLPDSLLPDAPPAHPDLALVK